MDCGLLYSAGKDSTLAALVLDDLFDVTLVSAGFGLDEAGDGPDGASAVAPDHDPVAVGREAADAVGFPFEALELDRAVAEDAVERMVADGYPRNGIQVVHEHALEALAATGEWDAVADGTRRDDRAPTVERSLAQSVEDRFGVEHVAPLAGFGRSAIDRLVEDLLVVESGPSDAIPTADYETELRALLAAEYGDEAVDEVFPEHTQSRVVGRR